MRTGEGLAGVSARPARVGSREHCRSTHRHGGRRDAVWDREPGLAPRDRLIPSRCSGARPAADAVGGGGHDVTAGEDRSVGHGRATVPRSGRGRAGHSCVPPAWIKKEHPTLSRRGESARVGDRRVRNLGRLTSWRTGSGVAHTPAARPSARSDNLRSPVAWAHDDDGPDCMLHRESLDSRASTSPGALQHEPHDVLPTGCPGGRTCAPNSPMSAARDLWLPGSPRRPSALTRIGAPLTARHGPHSPTAAVEHGVRAVGEGTAQPRTGGAFHGSGDSAPAFHVKRRSAWSPAREPSKPSPGAPARPLTAATARRAALDCPRARCHWSLHRARAGHVAAVPPVLPRRPHDCPPLAHPHEEQSNREVSPPSSFRFERGRAPHSMARRGVQAGQARSRRRSSERSVSPSPNARRIDGASSAVSRTMSVLPMSQPSISEGDLPAPEPCARSDASSAMTITDST